MSPQEKIFANIEGGKPYAALRKAYKSRTTIEITRLAGSAFAVYAASIVRGATGAHLFVLPDRDSAAYLYNDLSALLPAEEVLFFPTGYKRSIRFGKPDDSGIVQRTAAMNALTKMTRKGRVVLCTYPEALCEKVPAREGLSARTMTIRKGERVPMGRLEESLMELGFERMPFVYEPGQYSIRGGIVDIFSYSENRPYRLDFFDDEVDSIRFFDISSQLTVERTDSAMVVANTSADEGRVSLASFVGEATWWIDGLDRVLAELDDIRVKMLAEMDEPSEIDTLVTSAKAFLEESAECRMIIRGESVRRPAEVRIDMFTAPQPQFNKQFEMLASDIEGAEGEGYQTYIMSENKAQIERLQNVLWQQRREVHFEPLYVTLHEGFIDVAGRIRYFTDHQIFERYHRYKLRGEIKHDQSMTVAELNELKLGDYVVHVDHGVGVFGGMVQSNDSGRPTDYVKLVYKDGDVLFVGVHNLHRISKYKSADATPPKIYKLGSGAWQKLKTATKKAVKDIARELIALYAKRKAEGGYAFAPDNYLMHELEASFRYEETPDQYKAMEAVKRDMESDEPMDRLVCGDVGFGKTEVAVRAAFKAVCDSKQVAVLVPTTILSLQHYRTFCERLKGMPVRIEHLSRTKSAAETRQVLADVEAGKIDILIGTHKILGKSVKFHDLGLLIIDEEQKFGVSSKEKLRQLKSNVDTLTLTATPIPRTLQFSLMGSRDLSIISTPPPNRQPIVTESHVWSDEIVEEAVANEMARGGQVYFIHNRVEDIEVVAGKIRELCGGVRVCVAHGQMPADKVESVIMDFIYGEYDVLVATSIVENGIDIPNANTIIIDGAQNFGLSDLHQLRGRVGRSNRKAYCYLLSPPDELLKGDSRRRLRAIEEFSDLGSGFNIAMQDLDIRGAGNLFGAEQSGFIANIGFETYQKILAEAVAELRSEGYEGAERLVAPGSDEARWVDDCTIETDRPAGLPDSYIGQSAEKLRLYRQLDSLSTEQQLQEFAMELEDRFGRMPDEVCELLDVVRVRKACIALGVERAKIKNGLMILYFVGEKESPYFKSAVFNAILQFIMTKSDKFALRQNNNRLNLLVRNVKDIGEAFRLLTTIREFADGVERTMSGVTAQ
ncbi:MAG: transcription-repair coupling factor [Rikenellaceae bacterium]|nr:transcription-repair coupling factor [Rikenellaceae bacterium]